MAGRMIATIRKEAMCDRVQIMGIGEEEVVPDILEAAGLAAWRSPESLTALLSLVFPSLARGTLRLTTPFAPTLSDSVWVSTCCGHRDHDSVDGLPRSYTLV